MDYFSDKELGQKARMKKNISPMVWDGIAAHVQSLVSTGAFGEHFPDICLDGASYIKAARHEEDKMKKISIIFAIIACSLLVASCDQDKHSPKYQVLTANNNIYRVNTQSGEITVFTHNGIKKYDDYYIDQALQEESKLSQLYTEDGKTFPESNGQMWTKLYYKWRNNRILYRYSFGPYSDEIQKALVAEEDEFRPIEDGPKSSVTLKFLDKDGFPVVYDYFHLSSSTRIVDEHGSPTCWEKGGEIPCSKDDFMLITSNSVSWDFGKSSEEAIKRYAKVLKKKHADNWSRLKELIKSGKIMGKVEGDNLFYESRGRYTEVDKKNYALVESLLKNNNLIKSLQAKENKKTINDHSQPHDAQ